MARGRWNLLCALFSTFLLQNQVDPFVLEGSPSSYALFKKFKCDFNCSISFQFQTLEPNGLLLYVEDGEMFDFIEMKLVEGTLRLHFNKNLNKKLFLVENKLNDGHWHQVEIVHSVEETLFKLNQSEFGQVSYDTRHKLGSSFADSYLHIGGIPQIYRSNPNTLELPSVAFEQTFKGSIKHVLYTSKERPAKEQSAIEFKGIRSNHLNACKREDPCQHGGICISTDSKSICDCRTVDYKGTYCERAKLPSEITFHGDEYLYYQLALTQAIVALSDGISLYFKTRHANGTMIYTGHKEDFLTLTLRDGGIILTVTLGSKSEEKIIKPNGVRFDDNQWHRILVYRKIRKFSITVDGVYTLRASTFGPFSLLASSILYIGGTNPLSDQVHLKRNNYFLGCLRKVLLVADSLTLDLINLARNKNKLLHHHGNLHFMCLEVEAEDPISFITKDSFLALPSWNAVNSGNISFKFRTNEPNGVLMYNRGAFKQRDFFAFELFGGHLFLLLDLGSGLIKLKTTTRRMDNKLWHTVALTKSGRTGRVTVDHSAVEFITPGPSNKLDLEGSLILGGIGTLEKEESIPLELWSGILKYSYVGCIRDLVVNGKAIDIASFVRKQDSDGIRPSCHTSSHQCDSQPCLHGGKCSEGWNRFICDCSYTSFSGPFCAKDAVTLSLENGQFMKITMPESIRTQVEDVSLRFRTMRANSFMLATISDTTMDNLLIALELGRLKVTLNIAGNNEVLQVGRGLNDDRWHTVKIIRRGQSMLVEVDMQYVHKEMPNEKIILNFNSLHVGTLLLERNLINNELNVAKGFPNFTGQMQHFAFNGISFFDIVQNGHMTNVLTTAKFIKNGRSINHPITFKSKFAFITVSQLKAYSSLNLNFQFKTHEANGLLLYNGGKDKDFLGIELVDGHLHYIFNLGNGQRRLRSNTQSTLNDNHWHTVTINRLSTRRHTLMVDDMLAAITDSGSNVHLDLDDTLYLGGVKISMYANLSSLIKSNHGFKGCLASLDLNGDTLDVANITVLLGGMVAIGCIDEDVTENTLSFAEKTKPYEENGTEGKDCNDRSCGNSNSPEQLSTIASIDNLIELMYSLDQTNPSNNSINDHPSIVNQTIYFPPSNHVSVPYMPGKRNVKYEVVYNSKSSANSTILVIGIIAGVLVATIMIALMTYRVGNQIEESYTIDEYKNCQCAAGANAPSVASEHRINVVKSRQKPSKGRLIRDLTEWYV